MGIKLNAIVPQKVILMKPVSFGIKRVGQDIFFHGVRNIGSFFKVFYFIFFPNNFIHIIIRKTNYKETNYKETNYKETNYKETNFKKTILYDVNYFTNLHILK